MKPNAPRNASLIKQFPFLAVILAKNLSPWGIEDERNPIDDLRIKVEVADADLMFRQAHNVGLGEDSFSFSFEGPHKGDIMKRGEHLFAIGSDGKVANRLVFPPNEDAKRRNPNVYAWNVLWSEESKSPTGSRMLSGNIADQVEYLVWVTVSAWHVDTRDDAPGKRFGDLKERKVEVTIYRKPEEGFAALEKRANIRDNLRLHNSIITRAWLDKDCDLIEMSGRLNEICQLFKEEVFDNGMREMYEQQPERGASGMFGPVKVMMADMCGYNRVTLEDAVSSVTFQGCEAEGTLFSFSVDGTLPQVRNLVKTVIRIWNGDPAARSQFRANSNVSVI